MIELDIPSILFIALGLSADCLAVALSGSVSIRKVTKLQVFRTSLSFGIFQAIMPLLGWLIGRTVVGIVANYDHWVAFSLLSLVGGRMIWESARRKHSATKIDITRGTLLIILSIATSIDALAVGLSFAFLKVNIVLAASLIGAVAFTITGLGFMVGRRLGKLMGQFAEAIGGVVLILIGLRILLGDIL